MHGWIILDKPHGLGSTQGVSAVKRALREAGAPRHKVGHGGTLDPLATGVLPIAIGEATKLAGRMLDSDKVYDFTIRFGDETDTLDLEGAVIATSDVRPTLADVLAILPRFTGPIEQIPPAYSAIKVDGERAYDRARAGETFEIRTRSVTIHALSISSSSSSPEGGRGRSGEEWLAGGKPQPRSRLAEQAVAKAVEGFPLSPGRKPLHHPTGGPPPPLGEDEGRLSEITLTAHASKGTYIRSLARDIAQALGTVGHVTMLRRTKAGPFTLASAISLDKLGEAAKARALEDILLPLTAGLDDIPALTVSPDQARALREGRKLIGIAKHQGLHLATEGTVPVALVEVSGPEVRVVRGFNL